jgi:hypothetical protein
MEPEPTISALVTRLGRVRAGRVKPAWGAVVGGEVERARKELERRVRGSMAVTEAWRALAPADLVDHAWPTGIARGTLRIEVENAAFRYRLDRWLRGGGQGALLARCPASVRRVRLVTVRRDGA